MHVLAASALPSLNSETTQSDREVLSEHCSLTVVANGHRTENSEREHPSPRCLPAYAPSTEPALRSASRIDRSHNVSLFKRPPVTLASTDDGRAGRVDVGDARIVRRDA